MARTEELRASPPMFENTFLDRFTRVHPAVPPVLFGPLITLMMIVAFAHLSVPTTILMAVAGYVFWTLFEYWLHRIVFHFEPEGGIGARLHWMIHGVHHDHPNDPMRLVMPPSVSVPLGALMLWLFYLVMGWDRAMAFGGGFLAGYLAYDMLHYHVHHHVPRSALGRKLRELHMRHHFQDDETGFGISAPYWDRVFGTMPQQRRAASIEREPPDPLST
jgi:sterol desaturase/sphingolipid hydroxylase (fatty acid hydroxylase superfamily)